VGKCEAGQQNINKNSISQQRNSILKNSTTKIYQSNLLIRVTGFYSGQRQCNVNLLKAISSDLIQLPPGFFLHSADVIHVQLDPFINPTEQLPVEISEQALLLLLKEVRGTKFILEGEFCVVLTVQKSKRCHEMPI